MNILKLCDKFKREDQKRKDAQLKRKQAVWGKVYRAAHTLKFLHFEIEYEGNTIIAKRRRHPSKARRNGLFGPIVNFVIIELRGPWTQYWKITIHDINFINMCVKIETNDCREYRITGTMRQIEKRVVKLLARICVDREIV